MKKSSKGTEVYSIFGQIEEVAAQHMIDHEGAIKIEQNMIPPSAAFNDRGQRAKFAVILPRAKIRAFEEMIANLYA